VSNPKVFEFAKEIGMTPLALMDKIKEWHLPIKNHMAELEPEMLATIKAKLSAPSEPAAEDKPKKAATKKAAAPKAAAAAPKAAATKTATAKKAAEAQTSADAPKSNVIRRKTKEAEPAVEVKARVISKPEEVTEVVETPPVQAVPEVKAEPKVEPPSPVAQAPQSVAPAPAPVARKKEVAIGDSGVASSTAVASRRNIIGRMDLSRVQAPPGASQGYQRGAPSPGGGQGGGFQQRSPGGFSGPRPGGAAGGRNIRPGFVAQQTIPDPTTTQYEDDSKRDLEKKARKFSNTGGMSAKEKEQEELNSNFNAVEFRKREMVFQPKKKTAILNRDALKTQITTPKASKRVLKVNGKIKLGDMALEMGLKAAQIIKALMKNGVMANVNTDLDFDTVALTVPDFGWEAENTFKTAEDVVVETAFGDLDADQIIRPPVVTVMGHVDHGKTSLLDAIRQADVAGGEAGGITQHIGAYSVKAPDGSLITFLDTPGHEAFTAMRARGANATDIAIIVVAADDGMMPQTAEAINHAKAAGVPMIVAVNKMDKPGANPDRIKQQLTELEIVPEEWGGNTIFVEVSALKKTGIDKLLENIKLLAEVAELKANPKRSGTGLVIEAKLEKGRGPVATILVKDGHVTVGQYIVAGAMKGRVKSLTNDKGERVTHVNPGMPVEVLGLEGVPGAGDRFDVVKDERTAEEVVQIRKDVIQKEKEVQKKVSLEDLFSKVTQGEVKDFNIVLKADVQGSLEAIQGMLAKATSQEVKPKVIHAAVGGVNENDVLLAQTSKGVVIGFNVRPDNNAAAKAKQLGVDVRTYSIVYEMMDDIKKAMQGLLAPQVVEKVMGTAEVRNTFTVPKIGTIAGCFVTTGKIQRSNMLRLVREGKIIYEGKVSSLKRFKDDAKEVQEGFECGIGIENFNDIKVGDTIEAYLKEEIARELTPVQ
jgi:translation initiation factor IF-2